VSFQLTMGCATGWGGAPEGEEGKENWRRHVGDASFQLTMRLARGGEHERRKRSTKDGTWRTRSTKDGMERAVMARSKASPGRNGRRPKGLIWELCRDAAESQDKKKDRLLQENISREEVGSSLRAASLHKANGNLAIVA
jgi:hypothetical protein